MKTPQQLRDELETAVNESLATIRAVKGDAYADLVDHLHKMLHVGRLVRISVQDAPDFAQRGTMKAFAGMVTHTVEIIGRIQNMSEETLVEIVNWGKTLDNKTADLLKELNK